MSLPQRLWNLFARYGEKPLLAAIAHQPTLRQVARLHGWMIHARPRDLRVVPGRLGEVPVWQCSKGPDGEGQGVILWLHGGAYTVGGRASHAHWLADVARRTGLRGVLVDYRLAPEHPHPAALEDALAAYRAQLANTPAERIVLAGDSAGGGLALALLARLQAEGIDQPAALLLFSPWTDLTLTAPSLRENRRSEMMLPMAWLRRGARAYAGGRDPADPGLSPVFADFTAPPPPVLIQTGAGEILRDDSRRIAARLRDAGGQVTLIEEAGVGHIWPSHAGRSPEADIANARAADFLRQALGAATPAAAQSS